MNWKRVFMSVCCLLVVCCMIINISPIRAEASAAVATATVVALPSLQVIACCLIGLGIMAAVTLTDWEQIINDCNDYLTELGTVSADGKIDVYSMTGAGFGYGLGVDLVEAVREWMFAEEVVASVDNFAYYNGILLPKFLYSNGYFVLVESVDSYEFYWSNAPLFVRDDSAYLSLKCNGYWYKFNISDSDQTQWKSTANLADQSIVQIGESYNRRIVWTFKDLLYNTGGVYMSATEAVPCELASSYDITLGVVAGAGVGLAAGYAAWYDGALTFLGEDVGSDEEKVVILPAGIGQTVGEMASMTQEDVWAGTSTYIPGSGIGGSTGAGTATGTFADTAVGAFLEALAQSLLNPLTWLGEFILDGIGQPLTALGEFILDGLSVPLTALGQFILDGITTPLTALGDLILAGLSDLFVPDVEYINSKVNQLRERFAFADAIISTFEMFKTSLFPSSTSPPILYVDLGSATGSYYLGGKTVFIDMSFYEPYKPTGDALISAFLWIIFIWRVAIRLPGILRGASGVVNFVNAASVDGDI